MEGTVCLFGDYNINYPREAVIKRGLEKNNITVIECNCQIKYSTKPLKNKLLYLFNAYISLVKQLRLKRKNIKWFIVPHNNHLIIPLCYFISRVYQSYLIVDAFDPAYHTAVMLGENRVITKLRYYLEKYTLSLADLLLVETNEFKKVFMKTYGFKENKFFALPVGAKENFRNNYCYKPIKELDNNLFLILYWGNFHPHHGVEVIVEAAKILLTYDDIKFILVGIGRQRNAILKKVQTLQLANVEMPGFVPNDNLIQLINRADICLGIFSSCILAQCSITNKVLEAMANGKPVITEKSPATMEVFKDRDEIFLVPPDDPISLANAIIKLKKDLYLRNYISQQAICAFRQRFSDVIIGRDLYMALNKLKY